MKLGMVTFTTAAFSAGKVARLAQVKHQEIGMRARNIKPGFFENEYLADLSPHTRLLFIGLWCIADREGRLEDRPRRIHGQLFSYEPDVDCEKLLSELHHKGFIQRYETNKINYIQIPAFAKHQTPHIKERPSTIPAPCLNGTSTSLALLIPDSLIPDTPIPDSLIPETPPKPPQGGMWKSAAFEEFWKVAWAKIGKGAARKAFLRQVTTREIAAKVLEAAILQGPRLLREASQNGRSVLHPATWLNQERYDDESVSAPDPESSLPLYREDD